MKSSLRIALGSALAFTVLALAVALGWTTTPDSVGLLEAARIRTPALTGFMRSVSTLGSGTVLAPAGVALSLWFWNRRGRRVAGHYFATALLGWGCYGLLKWAFARPRPGVIERLDGAGWWSFPSGHAMASVIVLGFAVVLMTQRRLAWTAVGLLVAAIAFSRVYLGVHYPSDVVAGLCGGVAWVAAAVGLLRAETGPVRPVPGPGRHPGGQTS